MPCDCGRQDILILQPPFAPSRQRIFDYTSSKGMLQIFLRPSNTIGRRYQLFLRAIRNDQPL